MQQHDRVALPADLVLGADPGHLDVRQRRSSLPGQRRGDVRGDADHQRALAAHGVAPRAAEQLAGGEPEQAGRWKAVSTEYGMPAVVAGPGLTFEIAGDEHGVVRGPGPIDDVLWLSARHCDTPVYLFDTSHLVSGGRLIGTLPVAARGAVT